MWSVEMKFSYKRNECDPDRANRCGGKKTGGTAPLPIPPEIGSIQSVGSSNSLSFSFWMVSSVTPQAFR